jgi:hypothetical protein
MRPVNILTSMSQRAAWANTDPNTSDSIWAYKSYSKLVLPLSLGLLGMHVYLDRQFNLYNINYITQKYVIRKYKT